VLVVQRGEYVPVAVAALRLAAGRGAEHPGLGGAASKDAELVAVGVAELVAVHAGADGVVEGRGPEDAALEQDV
jgi:hypothetical protein